MAIQLVEAKTAGLGYKQFAQNLIWSLIAGFAVAGITANPKLGALVFTVTMNLKWDWLNDEQKEISKQLTQYDQFTQEYLKIHLGLSAHLRLYHAWIRRNIKTG